MAEMTKKEKLLIPLDPNGNSDTVFLCVNGKNMLVKRGEQVEIPAAFAEVYRNAQKQQAAAVQAQRAAMSNWITSADDLRRGAGRFQSACPVCL